MIHGRAIPPVLAAFLSLSAACDPGEVRDTSAPGLTRVTPVEIDAGGTLEVAGHALTPFRGRALTVTLDGAFTEPGGAREDRIVRIPAHYGGAGRIHATLGPTHVATLGARTLRFAGTVTLSAAGDGAPAPVSLADAALVLFPPNVQRAVEQYDVWRSERAATEALGLHVRQEAPAGYERPLPGGVEVEAADGAARRAGLRKGDRLVELNGAPLATYAALRLAALNAKDHASYTVLRGQVIDVSLDGAAAAGVAFAPAQAGPGVIVEGVAEQSPAWAAGLQTGDRLVAVNGVPLHGGDAAGRVAATRAALAAAGGAATLVTWRGELSGAYLSIPRSARLVPPYAVAALLLLLVCGVVLLGFMAPFAGIATFLERRIAGRMQSRIGPNRVGPQGLLQFVADGLKLIQKEDLIPDDADPILFRLAPYLVFLGVFLTFVALPFSSTLVPQNLNIGILYLLAVTSLVVVGILMSGWASNNKWSLLGGMRAAAQIVSYEIPASLSVLPVVLTAGSLSMQEIIRHQGGLPWEWNIFGQPALFLCFFMFFVSALAEGNRTPFDLPEAESELVSGYNTEYSGMRFAMFFLGEFANIYVMSAIAVTLFLGGWQLPAAGPLTDDVWRRYAPTLFSLLVAGAGAVLVAFAVSRDIWRGVNPRFGTPARVAFSLLGTAVVGAGAMIHAPQWLAMEALRLAAFQAKALPLVFVVIWIRWTLPRLRVDQMMSLCWKYLVPFAIGSFLFTALWLAYVPAPAQSVVRGALTAFGAFAVFVFIRRTVRTFKATRSVLYANPFV